MSEIFKINLEPKIDYENTNFEQIKQILKNWRLNISEEIKCLLFIKNKIDFSEDKKEDNNLNNIENEYKNMQIDEKIFKKYTKIFDKLEELCFQEINLISETIVSIDDIINNNNKEIPFEAKNEYIIYDKIYLTLNNYNKIVENINKTISSYPGILHLYLLYIKEGEDENKFIRENIKNEEEKYESENIYINMEQNNQKTNIKNKNKSTGKIKAINTTNNNFNESKRERMIKFSKSVKNKKFKRCNTKIGNKNNKNNKININQIKFENNFKKENLKEIIIVTENIKNTIKDYSYNNCVKENEMKNLLKMKEDNIILNKEILNIKESIRELNNLYEYQLEKLELLQNEQTLLEKENLQLYEYINKILKDKEQKISNLNCEEFYKINSNNNNIEAINQNINNNSIKDNHPINITFDNYESIEMFKRLNKL